MLLISRGTTSPNVSPHDPLVPSLLEALPVPTALLDGAGRIVHCNEAWRQLADSTTTFGDLGTLVTPADHPGSAYLRRLAALEGPLAAAAHRLAREAQEVLAGHRAATRVDYRRRKPDGEDSVEALVSALPSNSGALALLQHAEVSDRERAADAQASALRLGLDAEIERAKRRSLQHRLASLSRDLHTPITPVRLELHLLANQALGPLAPAQERALEVITRNVQRWADSEQAFVRLSAQDWLPAANIGLGAVASASIDRLMPQALAQGVRLLRPSGKADWTVHASPDLLADVVDILIQRALTASSAGSTVAVEVGRRGDEAFLDVRDSGPGASPREVRELFAPWGGRRPDPAAPAPFQLPYVRSAVEAAGGRVYAESDGAGSGLLLGLALPLAAVGGPVASA